MKSLLRFCAFLTVAGLLPSAFGALNRQNNLLGKMYVSNVTGVVTCVSDGRILELKKGDSVMARGAIVESSEKANVTLVFSNGTGVYVDENTKFEVRRFEQEFFAPNNNLRVEPSNSNTLVRFHTGRVVLSTPRLLSGTTMVYETDLAQVLVRGEKLMIESTEKQTHVAMIEGGATVNPKGPDGKFVSIGKRLTSGQEAFVKYVINAENAITTTGDEPAPNAASGLLASTDEILPPPPLTPAATSVAGAATIVRVTGHARAKSPTDTAEFTLKEGATLAVGTEITTDESAEIHLQPFPGAIATLRPSTKVQIEKVRITTDEGMIKKQQALLSLKSGTVVSTIDPAMRYINEYGVRTPKGIAAASGTSFTVSTEDDGLLVATTADAVVFTLADGASYTISQGTVSSTDSGGTPQPPVPIATAIAGNPELASVITTAVTTISNVIQNNVGGLSAASVTDLASKVLAVAATALPGQADTLAGQLVTAINSPAASTAGAASEAVAAVVSAAAIAAPDQATEIAAAAATAAPSQNAAIAQAAAQASPDQASGIAAAITQTFAQGTITPAILEAARAVSAAGASGAPGQAASIAAAVMQVLMQSDPAATPQSSGQMGSSIAAATTAAAPNQAVPIAATMMKLLANASPEATPQVLGQVGTALAGAITAVVPPQSQQVATAVLQLISEISPEAAASARSSIANAGPGSPGSLGGPPSSAGSPSSSAGGPPVAGSGNSAGGNSSGGDADNPASNTSTSIIVSMFDPGALDQVTSDLEAAQNAQSGVSFSPDTTGGGGGTVTPQPNVPPNNPIDHVGSPARKG